jgi:hypothetical protein
MDNPCASLSPLQLQALTVTGQGDGGIVKFDGFTLRPGQSIYSPNKKQKFMMQVDGNLVFLKLNEDGSEGKVIWASNTNNHSGAYAVFQDDGNLVVYIDGLQTKPLALWASFTDQTGTDNYGKGIFFNLPDVGQMRIVVQKTNSSQIRSYSPFSLGQLNSKGFVDHFDIHSGLYLYMDGKTSLYTNQYIMWYYTDRQLKLIMQADHNLVLYRYDMKGSQQEELLWTSNTGGTGADRALFLDTGNLVVYSVHGGSGGILRWQSEWESGTDLAGTQNYGQGWIFGPDNDGYLRDCMSMEVRKANAEHHEDERSYFAFYSGDKFRCGPRLPVKFDGFTLYPGKSIYSPTMKQQFEMQGDGNLVLYKRNEDGSRNAVWLSKTGFQDWDAYAVFQDDGNLVIYSDDTPRKVLWASFTDPTGIDNYGKGILFNLPDVGPLSITVQKTNSSEIRSYSPFEDGKKFIWVKENLL